MSFISRSRLILLSLLIACSVHAQEIRILSQAVVKPPRDRWYPWYQIEADPADSRKLIVCGSEWRTNENALYGFVSSSSDGGRSWQTALEDHNSNWVSEPSCAMGIRGQAYFVSEAAEVVYAIPRPEPGVTRIYSSTDAGRHWYVAARTQWADYSASVTDTANPPGARLYTFFNNVDWKNSAAPTTVGLLIYRKGRSGVRRPILSPGMASYGYQGSFPRKAIILKDGTVLAIYRGTLKGTNGPELEIGTIRLDKKHDMLLDPIPAVHVTIRREESCFIDDAEAYDRQHDRLYIAYHKFVDGKCKFMMTASYDEGRTWAEPWGITEPDSFSRSYHNPVIAVNREGVLGLLWRDTLSSDCWYFSASITEGRNFTSAQPLSSACSRSPDANSVPADAFIETVIRQQPTGSEMRSGATVRIVNHRDGVFENASALAITADGTFHPVWVQSENRHGELRTASVTVGASHSTSRVGRRIDENTLGPVTGKIAVLFGGSQQYDACSGRLIVTLAIENRSHDSLYGPLSIKVLSLTSELGDVEILNSNNGNSGAGAIWKIQPAYDDVLKPYSKTLPFQLSFRIKPKTSEWPSSFNVVSLKLEILGAIQERSRLRE